MSKFIIIQLKTNEKNFVILPVDKIQAVTQPTIGHGPFDTTIAANDGHAEVKHTLLEVAKALEDPREVVDLTGVFEKELK